MLMKKVHQTSGLQRQPKNNNLSMQRLQPKASLTPTKKQTYLQHQVHCHLAIGQYKTLHEVLTRSYERVSSLFVKKVFAQEEAAEESAPEEASESEPEIVEVEEELEEEVVEESEIVETPEEEVVATEEENSDETTDSVATDEEQNESETVLETEEIFEEFVEETPAEEETVTATSSDEEGEENTDNEETDTWTEETETELAVTPTTSEDVAEDIFDEVVTSTPQSTPAATSSNEEEIDTTTQTASVGSAGGSRDDDSGTSTDSWGEEASTTEESTVEETEIESNSNSGSHGSSNESEGSDAVSPRNADDDVTVCAVKGIKCHLLEFGGFSLGTTPESDIENIGLRLSFGAEALGGSFTDDKLYVRYNVRGHWYLAGEVTIDDSVSNNENGGHFAFELPEIEGWEDLDDMKVQLEFVRNGDSTTRIYLDGVWLDTTFEIDRSADEDLFGDEDNVLAELQALEDSASPDVLVMSPEEKN